MSTIIIKENMTIRQKKKKQKLKALSMNGAKFQMRNRKKIH